jgi:dipeptidyl aminopeptidase/acylaminoacyl peptidase
MLFFVEGGVHAERYVLFDRATKKVSGVANSRPSIKPDDVGEVITIEYKARDGLKIPGLITWPTGVAPEERKNLPLVVMPHGGPEAYDAVGFDWLAQFLANEGYAVLQPNFRGSAGFGMVFRQAGRGQWGRKMQDDITDGANALAKMGWVDPNRICIVGWSYGGYAALAGGALTPDLYKCVASIAGVSNLREMLATERRLHGSRSRTVTYWEEQIGDPDKDREAIDAVSPSRLADRFSAPVLLVHGIDDTTVPVQQSDMMNDALKNAKKTVQYIRIKGDDHGLVDNGSRRSVLTSLAEFLAKHIGR